ncbi:MAG: hypothetical protein QNL14_13395 [Deltaproteobacteria bacterium]|nr:hypothetical protein [Deltaproteobacteria bacterium]
MPGFFIFDCSVVRLSPKISAAPPRPPMRQPLFFKTLRTIEEEQTPDKKPS